MDFLKRYHAQSACKLHRLFVRSHFMIYPEIELLFEQAHFISKRKGAHYV